jgi:superfamily II DNA helicase RecQ
MVHVQVGGGVTVLVSPLVALMDDQLAELARLGIVGVRLTAETPKEEARALKETLLDPTTAHLVRRALPPLLLPLHAQSHI